MAHLGIRNHRAPQGHPGELHAAPDVVPEPGPFSDRNGAPFSRLSAVLPALRCSRPAPGRRRDWLSAGLPLLAGLLLAVSFAASGRGEQPADATQAADLVEQLGDTEFTTRERATAQLLKMGLAARDALRIGSEHPDREIRYRSRRILAMVQDLDFENRLQAFMADSNSQQDHDLPGWKQYRVFAGDDQDVRQLFVDMQRAENELLAAIDEGPKAAANVLNARITQIREAMQLHRNQLIIGVGSVSALMFAALQDEVTLTPQNSQIITNFLYQPSFNDAINGGGGRPAVLRRMLGEWIRQRTTDVDSYQAIMLALRYGVKEGLVPAQRALRQALPQLNQPSNAHLRQYGLLTIARFGGPEHLPLVEPLLEDTTNYGGQIRVDNKNIRTQIRDIALATLVKLTGQEYRDYGFTRLQPHEQYVFNSSTLGFEDDASREKAIQKWREYRKTAGAADTSPPQPAADKDAEQGPDEK